MKNVLTMMLSSVTALGCSLGCLGTSCLSVLVAVILILALLASIASYFGQALGAIGNFFKGNASSSTLLVEHSPVMIAINALLLDSHLQGNRLQNYDPSDPFMQKMIQDWLPTCHNADGSLCEVASNGDLQCVEFVTGAFLLSGITPPYAHDAHYFWPDYQNKAVQSAWQEIPAGSGLPQPGDIIVWHSWHYDAQQRVRVEDAGHVAVAVGVVPPHANTFGRVYFAQANAYSPITVRDALNRDAGGELVNILGPTILDARLGVMTIYPDLSVQDNKNLEDVYHSSGSVVDGYIRYRFPLSSSSTRGYTVTGPPTISADLINQVLAFYKSPAAGQGQALYDLGVQYGIDPAFALAFFMHESQFGTTGEARYTLSLGNERCIPDRPCIDQDRGGYAQMYSWQDGFEHWYQLIKGLYVGQWHLSTVEQIVPVYAPSSDNNNVTAYIQAVERAVDTWRSGRIQV